jgi:hypothetical protein
MQPGDVWGRPILLHAAAAAAAAPASSCQGPSVPSSRELRLFILDTQTGKIVTSTKLQEPQVGAAPHLAVAALITLILQPARRTPPHPTPPHPSPPHPTPPHPTPPCPTPPAPQRTSAIAWSPRGGGGVYEFATAAQHRISIWTVDPFKARGAAWVAADRRGVDEEAGARWLLCERALGAGRRAPAMRPARRASSAASESSPAACGGKSKGHSPRRQ